MRYLLIFSFLLAAFTMNAQMDRTDADANFDDNNFEVALKQYRKIYKKFKDDAEVNYRVGVCILNTNEDRTEALGFFKIADSLSGKSFPSIKLDMARSMYYSNKFDEATVIAKEYMQGKISSEDVIIADRLIENCAVAKKLMAKPVKVKFENLGENVNSKQDDYIPYITEDEQLLYFSTNRKYNNDYQQFLKGVFFCQKDASRNWAKAKSAGAKINSDENEQLVGISKDGNTLLVHVDRLSAPNDIYISEKKKTAFTELVPLPKNINSKYAEMGASLSRSGDTMFFASDRPEGLGGYDIYMTRKLPDGSWGIPQNLGEPINTPADENFPYITANGYFLYYSSNGAGSIGGYDVFVSDAVDEGRWSPPRNLGYPINNFYDNFSIIYTANGRYGYTSRYDKAGLGGLDCFRIIMEDIPPTSVVYTGNILYGTLEKQVPVHEKSAVLESIDFYVTDDKTGKEVSRVTVSARNSKYTFALIPGKYTVTIKGKGFTPYTRSIFIADEQPVETVIVENIILISN